MSSFYKEDDMFEPLGEVIDDPDAVSMANDSWHAPDVPMDWADANPFADTGMGTEYGAGFDDMTGGGLDDMMGMEDEGMDMMGEDMMMPGAEPSMPSAGEAATMRDAMIARMQEDAAADEQYQQKAIDTTKRERKMGKM